MQGFARTAWKIFVTLAISLFSLPMLIYGGYFLVCWIRIHTSHPYYVEYPYLTAAIAWLSVGTLSFVTGLHAVWRRSYYGILFLIPLVLGLGTMALIPDNKPQQFSMTRDGNYVSYLHSSLNDFYATQKRYPLDQSELNAAIVKSAGESSMSTPQSEYMQNGNPLPYENVVTENAKGPRTAELSKRPGVLYYSVSADHQEFWVTMTALDSEVQKSAVRKWNYRNEEWVLHSSSREQH
jgi:hypothetical protein